MTTANDDNQLLRSMLEYYDQRAQEYDQWYLRLGRYDTPDLNDQWFHDLAHLARIVAEFVAHHANQPVLELACGTGFWSALAARPCRLIATDPAPAMLLQARSRLRAAGTSARLVRADAYHLPFAGQSFAAAFAGFFISHVPSSCLDPLFAELARVVRRGGRTLLFDGLRASRPAGSAPQHHSGQIQLRPLNDGRVYPVLKIYYQPPSLTDLLTRYGRDVSVTATQTFFLAGSVTLP